MAMLVDSGVLLRVFDTRSPDYRRLRRAVRKLLLDGESLIVAVQNSAEFWNVCTRPLENNGQGMPVERAERRLQIIEQFSSPVSESVASYQLWKQLVLRYQVTGVAVHDARLVAVMLTLGIRRIFTLNPRDFRRYEPEGIEIVTLDDLATGA